ncbi:hypothetical protein HNY73_005491 [Argiope bruennichi]|uniref:Uncharacterized protein n=1 Tax=Argiope bruennichi TaxID=94029 RepID=A0A8T0FNX8_ARGBR|nr:hypothetical protein HNY73_005491 [Argiope bruennichi]
MPKIQMIFCCLLLGGYAIPNSYSQKLSRNEEDIRILPSRSRPQWSQFLFLGPRNTENPNSNGYFYQIDPYQQSHHKILTPNERIRVPSLIHEVKNLRLYEQRNIKEIQEPLHGQEIRDFPQGRSLQSNYQQMPLKSQNNGYSSGATQEIETVNLETNGFKIPNKRILNSASIPVKAELNKQTYFPHQNFEYIKMNADSIHLPRDPIRENQNQKIHLVPIQIDAAPNGQIGLSHKNFEHAKINAEPAQLSRSAQRESQNERINIKSQKVYAIVPKKKNCNVASCLNDSAESATENNTNRIKNISPIVSQKTNSSTQIDKSQGQIMNQSPLIRNLSLRLTPESIIKHQKSQQTFIHSNAKPSHIFGMNLKMQENHTKLEDTQSSGFVTTHKPKIKKLPSTNQRRESQRNWRKVAPNQRIQRTQNKQFIQDFIESTTERSITSVQQIQHETTTEISKLDYLDEDAIFSDSFSTALFGQRLRPVKPLSQENKKFNTQNLPSTDTNSSKSETFHISLLNPNTVNNTKRKQYESSLAELNKKIFNLFWDSERLQTKNESRNSKFEEALLQENIPEISNIKSTTPGIDNDSLKLISYSDYMLDGTTGEEFYTTENIPKRKLKPNSFTTIRKIGMNAEHKSGKQNPKQPDQSFSSHQNTPKRKTNPLNSPQLKPQNIFDYKSTSIPAHHRFANPYIFQTEDFYKQERFDNDMKNMKNMNNNKQKLNADSQSFRSQPAEIERENNPLDAPQLQQDNTESYELTATTKFREPKEPNISQTDYIKSLKNAVLKLKVQVLPITENETLEKTDAEIKPHSVHHLHVFTNVYSKLPPNQIQSYFGPVKQYYIPPSHYHYPRFSYASDPLSNAQTQFSLITPSFQEWQQLERNKTLKSTIRDQEQTIDDSDPPLSAKSKFYRNADFTLATETTTPQSLESKTVKSASNKLEKIREKEETETSTTVVSAGSPHQVLHFGLTGNFKPVIIFKASELPREVNGRQKNFENDNHRKMQFSPAPEVATNSEIKCDTYSFSGSSVTCHSYLENEDTKLNTTNTESKNKDRLIVTESLSASNQYGRHENLNATRKAPYLTNSDNQKSDLQIEIPATVKQQNNFYKNNTTDKKTHIIWLKHRESKNESSLAGRIPTPSKKHNDLYRNLNESKGISTFRSINLANNSLKSITNLARNNDTFNLYNIKAPNPDESHLHPQIKNASVNTKITEKANIHSSANNNSQDFVTQPLLEIFQTGNKFESLTITDVKKNNEKLTDHQKQEFQLLKQDHPTLLKLSQMASFNPNISGELTKLTENSDDIISNLEEEEVKYHVNKTKENFKVIAPLEIGENDATTVDPYTFITVTTDNYNEISETTTIKYQTILENKVHISATNETDFMKSRNENSKSEDMTSTNISESTLMENSNVLLEYVSATAILEDATTEKPTNVEFSSKQSKEMESIVENIPFTEEVSIGMMKIEKQKPETKPSVLFDKDLSPNNTEVNVKLKEEFNQNTTQSINISHESQNALLLQQLLNISIHSQEKNLSSKEILQTNEGLKINQMNKPKAANEQNFTRNEHIILTEGTTQKTRTSNFTERNDKNATFSDITHKKTAQSLNESSSQNNTDLNVSTITKQMKSDVKTPVNRISNFNTQQNNQNLNYITVTHEPSTELNIIEKGTTLSIVVTEKQMSSHD